MYALGDLYLDSSFLTLSLNFVDGVVVKHISSSQGGGEFDWYSTVTSSEDHMMITTNGCDRLHEDR